MTICSSVPIMDVMIWKASCKINLYITKTVYILRQTIVGIILDHSIQIRVIIAISIRKSGLVNTKLN